MKIKFNTFDKVNNFIKSTSTFESDIFIKSGKYVVDGKSLMGLYSLDLSKELEVEIIEKVEGESDRLTNILNELGIVL